MHGPQHAVHPKTHEGVVALGFEVDVRGAVLERLVEDAVESGYDRAGGGFQIAGGLRPRNELLVRRGRIGVLAVVVGQLGFRGPQRGPQVVEAAVDPLDVRTGRDHDLYPDPQIPFEVRDGPAVEGVRDRHRQGARIPGEGADGVPAGERRRESAGDDLRVEFQGVDRPKWESGVLRDCLRDVLFREDSLGHQRGLVSRRRQPLESPGAAGHRGGDAPLAPEQGQQAGNRVRDGAGSGVGRCRDPGLVGASWMDGVCGGPIAGRRWKPGGRAFVVKQLGNLHKALDVVRPSFSRFGPRCGKVEAKRHSPPVSGGALRVGAPASGWHRAGA